MLPAHREHPHRGRAGRPGARRRLRPARRGRPLPGLDQLALAIRLGDAGACLRRRALVGARPAGTAVCGDARGCRRAGRAARCRRGTAARPAGTRSREARLGDRADPAAAPGERRRLGARDPGPRRGDGRDRARGGRAGGFGRGPGHAPPHGWRRGRGRRVPRDGDLVPGRRGDRVRGGGGRTRGGGGDRGSQRVGPRHRHLPHRAAGRCRARGPGRSGRADGWASGSAPR